MEVHEAMFICFKNKIKCYPVKTVLGWKIEYVINNNKYKFDKIVNSDKDKNKAMEKTYIFLAKKYC